MARHPNAAPLLPLTIDPHAALPRYRQLYAELRRAILARRLPAGSMLPSSRALASELALSRATVVSALEQLIAEGYIVARPGAGYVVAHDLPDDAWQAITPEASLPAPQPGPALSIRGQHMATLPTTGIVGGGPLQPFRVGVPALDAFPIALWIQVATRRQRQLQPIHLHAADPAGEAALRAAIAAYVQTARGVVCSAEQVIVCSGSQQALDLIARLLIDPGDAVWVEDPGYLGARSALAAAGAQLVPVPVDAEGIDVAAGVARSPQARLAYVTPAHQYPLGVPLSLARRLALLEWARRANAWVLEGDYDGEYRYSGRPLAALQGLDPDRVCYLGTFSKTLFPTLRLGYVIVPPEMVTPLLAARQLVDLHPPVVEQLILADWMADGHFVRHVRQMRHLYAARQQQLRAALQAHLGAVLDVPVQPAGMQVLGWLPLGSDDAAVSQRIRAHGVEAPPLSAYCLEAKLRPALLFGFAGVTDAQIQDGVKRVALALGKP